MVCSTQKAVMSTVTGAGSSTERCTESKAGPQSSSVLGAEANTCSRNDEAAVDKQELVQDSEVIVLCSTKLQKLNVLSVLKKAATSEIDFAARRSLLRYKCDKCGRECPSKHKLKRHLSTHSDARPFPCRICARSFKWSEYLQKHMRLQHPLGEKGPLPTCSTILASRGKELTGVEQPSAKDVMPQVKSQDHAKGTQNQSVATNAADNDEEKKDLPSKQSVSIGVDMDAEEEMLSNLPVTTCTPHTQAGDMDYGNERTSYNTDSMPGGDSQSTTIVEDSHSTVAHQFCYSSVSESDSFNFSSQIQGPDPTAAYLAAITKSQCNHSTDRIFAEPCQYNHMNANSSMSCGDFSLQSSSAPTSELVSTVTSLITNDVEIPDSQLHFPSPNQYYNSDCYHEQLTYTSMPPNPIQDSNSTYMDIPPPITYRSMDSGMQHVSMDSGMQHVSMDNGMQHVSLDNGMQHVSMDSGMQHVSMDSGMQHVSIDNGMQHVSMDNGMQHGSVDNGMQHGSVDNGMQHGSVDSGMQHGSVDSGMQHGSVNSGMQHGSVDSGMQHGSVDNGMQHVSVDSGVQHGSMNSGMQHVSVDSGVQHVSVDNGMQHMSVNSGMQHVSVGSGIQHMSMDSGMQHGSVDSGMQHGSVGNGIQHVSMDSGMQHGSVDSGMQHASVDSRMQHASVDSGIQQVSVDSGMQHMSMNHGIQHTGIHYQISCSTSLCGADRYTPQQYEEQNLPDFRISKAHQLQPNLIPSDDEPVQSEFVVKKVKVDIGIQCEVGPETLQALLEDEEDALDDSVKEVDDQSPQYNKSTISSGNDISSDDRLVQKFPCRMKNCNKAYIHRKDVIRHMRIRHGITPCKLEAIVVETPEKPHLCGIGCCRRSYFHMKDLRRHRRLCHQVSVKPAEIDEVVNTEPIDLDNSQMRYPCDFEGCLRSYVHKKDLVRHKRLYHEDSSSKPSIPFPLKYTDTDLKLIRKKVKQEIDTKEKKMRLDSTGSAISISNSIDEERICTNDVDIDDNTDCTILLSSSSSLHDVRPDVELDESTISDDVASILGALEQHSSHLFAKDH